MRSLHSKIYAMLLALVGILSLAGTVSAANSGTHHRHHHSGRHHHHHSA